MNITEFIEFAKKHGNLSHDDEELKKNWNDLLEKSKKTNMLRLCFHTLLEISFPCAYLKEIIEYEEKGKQEILSSEDTFKWACAFGEPELIVYLNDKVKEHNINGAIQATISQYRLDNLKTLVSLGYEKEIYREPNLCQAISTASMVGGGLVIVDYLLRNRKKFPSLSPYVWNKLEEQEWMSKIVDDNFYVILETLLEIKSPKIKKMIIKSCDYIMSMVLICDHKELLNKIMNSYVREDFSVKYREIKSQTLKHSMSLDTNKATEFIIEKYPELIEHKDIELFMMNGNSLNIAKLIKSKRDFTKEEIKEAFLRLSTSEICVLRLLVDVPDIDYRMFTLKEALKISNQLYEDKAYGEIDYSYDGWYMNFNRNVLLKNKDFNKNMEKIRETILDEKMYSLLEKEQLKMNFEEKFPSKPVIKKLKL